MDEQPDPEPPKDTEEAELDRLERDCPHPWMAYGKLGLSPDRCMRCGKTWPVAPRP